MAETTAPATDRVSDAQLADDVRVLRLTMGELEPDHRGHWLDEGDLMNALIDAAPDGSVAPMQEAAYLYACRPDRIARVLRRLEQEMEARTKRLRVAIAAAHDDADPIDLVADHRKCSREEAIALMRAALAASGAVDTGDISTAGKPLDAWIPVSERLPEPKQAVLVAVEFDRPGDWRIKVGGYAPDYPEAHKGWHIHGASWAPSHWMPLPPAPGTTGVA